MKRIILAWKWNIEQWNRWSGVKRKNGFIWESVPVVVESKIEWIEGGESKISMFVVVRVHVVGVYKWSKKYISMWIGTDEEVQFVSLTEEKATWRISRER